MNQDVVNAMLSEDKKFYMKEALKEAQKSYKKKTKKLEKYIKIAYIEKNLY